MNAYADFDFYTNIFFGNVLKEDEFPHLAITASRYIDAATLGRSKKASGRYLTAVQMATCAVAEVFGDEEYSNAAAYSDRVASETVGGWSRSYSSGSGKDDAEAFEKRKRDAMLLWLSDGGLLDVRGYYAGVRP